MAAAGQNSNNEPSTLASIVSEYIARKGLARVQGNSQLEAVWKSVCGEDVAAKTRVLKLSRGILEVAVSSSGLCSELVSFHRAGLVAKLKDQYPEGKVKDIKFRLKTGLR